jgi:pyruvate/2-oxoacid:ferredoxin oxidoreductase alpha subunit
VAPVEIPEQALVDDFLPLSEIPHRLDTVPHTLGQIELPHQNECHRFQHHTAMLGAPAVYGDIRRDFETIFGRALSGAVMPHRCDDAETLIVSMGTIGITAERVVDELRQAGQRVGALRIRLFRPLPVEDIRAAFAGKKRIAILDRNIGLGLGGVLWSEARALADPGAVMQNYLTGLGGGDVRPEHIAKIVSDIALRESSGAPLLMEAV